MLTEEKIRNEKEYMNGFFTNREGKGFHPTSFFSRQNMVLIILTKHYLRVKMKKNCISDFIEQKYRNDHPFKPELISYSELNSEKSLKYNLGEELNKIKIPLYDKLYR